MVIPVSVIVQLLLLSIFVSAALAVWSWSRRNAGTGAQQFSFLMASNVMYGLTYLAEIHAGDLERAMAWMSLEYVAVSAMPALLWLFTERFCRIHNGAPEGNRLVLRIFLLAMPLVIAGLVASNGMHHLVYSEVHLMDGVPLSIVVARRGPLFATVILYYYGLTAFSVFRLVHRIRTMRGALRLQALLVLGGILMTLAGHLLNLFHLIPYRLDMTPIAFGLGGGIIASGLRRSHMFDLVPVAREKIMDALDEGIAVFDHKGRLVDMNRGMGLLFPGLAGFSPGMDVSGFLNVLPGLNPRVLESDWPARLHRNIGGNGKAYLVRSFGVGESGKTGRIVMIQDMTAMADLMDRLGYQADHDGLTGLLNRRAFLEQGKNVMEKALQEGMVLSVAVLDLDHFKNVNDTWGHATGDAVLVQVAKCVASFCPAGGLAARMGGEEFACIMPGFDSGAAMDLMEKMRGAVAGLEWKVEGQPEAVVKITVSTGIASLGDFPVTADRGPGLVESGLLSRADEAMYRAKVAGRNRVFNSLSPSRGEPGEALDSLMREWRN